ncbi:twitching motility protein PilJ [Nitrosomonas sp. Nm51]|uniref:methyl-accepting chemotaxis protein n=1 Tax=Nitrosomonas sp. Nm51 TaxID=133720 RepID=UPI0008BD5FF9|nr:methyl-accepting chemotaxis protein [Nitrosomonas sp. Nm51]SER18649.1 twitching motility protein PilJ [Nitrosomonas sp. Nm51]
MTGIFSKFKSIFKSEKKTKLPDTAPVKNSNHAGFSKTTIYSGSAFVLSALSLIVVLAYNLEQTRENTVKLEITARMQTHTLRLSTMLQLIFSGQKNAFAQLGESYRRINQYLALLTVGGGFRHFDVSAITQSDLLDHLEDLIQKWQPEEKKIHLILNHQHTLVNLGKAVSDINTTSAELNQKLDLLIDRLSQTADSPGTLGALTTMRTLTQNVTRSVNVMLSSKLPVPEIKKQLAHDRKQFFAILQAFNHGHDILNLSAIDDPDVQKLLPTIETYFLEIDNNINTIQTEISDVMTARAAANEIIQKSDIIFNSIVTLDKALQIEDTDTADSSAKLHYGLAAITALSLCILAYTFGQKKSSVPEVAKYKMDDTQAAMLNLLDDMKKMAEGDLTVRTAVTEDITGVIADAVNFTIEELHALVKQINKASTQVVNTSGQAQQISARLLSAVQQQSRKIEETTVTVLDMAESINQVSDIATESAEVAKQSLSTAEKGGIAVQESIAGMEEIRTHIQETSKRIKRLGESSQEIGEIIALVSDITEQTNILALNAALQATAAGEAGRGFNTIAQEVQRLAERSVQAGKQISRLIKMIQNDTYDTIAAMERSTREVIKGAQKSNIAGKALEEIEAVSKRLADHVAQIYTTTHTQTQAAKQVIENMEEILLVTRQATDSTQQTTASIKQISGFVTELKVSVANFKI